MSSKPETRFKEKVIRDLKTIPGIWFTKIQQASIRGTPDLIICLAGKFIAIELKADEKSPISDLQIYTIEIIKKAGGFGLISHPKSWPTDLKLLRTLSS